MALSELKKRNAAKLEEKRIAELRAEGKYVGPPKLQDHEKPTFPKRKNLEANSQKFILELSLLLFFVDLNDKIPFPLFMSVSVMLYLKQLLFWSSKRKFTLLCIHYCLFLSLTRTRTST